MKKIPVKYKRVAEAFDIAARERLCEICGIEHSPENSMNLSDLVETFIENDRSRGEDDDDDDLEKKDENDEVEREERESSHQGGLLSSDSELRARLRELFDSVDEMKRNIVSGTEQVYQSVGNVGFKHRFINQLRERGFDTGICKSKWDKSGHIPSGSYEYIDVDISGTRYIIEVHLVSHFEIARPTETYSSLLKIFPTIYVGKLEDFKKIVRLMCNAMKHSMKSTDMALPPWRRYRYMLAKWFGSYKRTCNEESSSVKKEETDLKKDGLARKRLVGFVPLAPAISYYCRGDFASTVVGFNVGQVEFNGNNMLL